MGLTLMTMHISFLYPEVSQLLTFYLARLTQLVQLF